MRYLFIVLLLSVAFSVLALDQSKAIEDSAPEKGIKLSPKAQVNIGIKTERIGSIDQTSIPKSSLVYTKDRLGIYCLRDGWFKFVEVQILSKSENSIRISSKGLSPNEVIVIEGAALLRVSEMEAFSSEE